MHAHFPLVDRQEELYVRLDLFCPFFFFLFFSLNGRMQMAPDGVRQARVRGQSVRFGTLSQVHYMHLYNTIYPRGVCACSLS